MDATIRLGGSFRSRGCGPSGPLNAPKLDFGVVSRCSTFEKNYAHGSDQSTAKQKHLFFWAEFASEWSKFELHTMGMTSDTHVAAALILVELILHFVSLAGAKRT